MRDEKPFSIDENNFNIIVNLHSPDGTPWVLVIRREGAKTYYFDSFGVETPPLFLEEYVDLGSDKRIQEYDESDCGAYCLNMIYLIDRGFRIKSALNILINQVTFPRMYDECLGYSCKGKVDDYIKIKDNDNDYVNDNLNDNDNDNVI